MKKTIISAAIFLVGISATCQAQTSKSNLEFQRYIAKNVSYYTSFANDGIQGTIRIKMNVTSAGLDSIDVISGINPKIDKEVADLIKRTPTKIVDKMVEEKSTTMIVPVRLVLKEN